MVDKLYRGIFWIKDIERFASVVIKAECNSNGFFVTVPNFELLAKSGKEFNLSKENGINSVTIKADMSNHYLCYLDEER